MKFKEYLEGLQKLATDYPEILEMNAFYAEDEEGNGFKVVDSNGTIVRMSDPEAYSPEFIGALSDEIPIDECNGVIIN